MFGDTEIKKRKFRQRINLILLEDIYIEKMQVSSRVSSGEKNHKCFIGYKNDAHQIKSLHIILPKISAYVKMFDGETNWMCFFIEDDELFEIYSNFWNKIKNSIKKELDCEPVYKQIF